MGFSDLVREGTSTLTQAILNHPFNLELAAGTLDPVRFRRYAIQDRLYLEAFSQTLALAAARAPAVGERGFFLRKALESVAAEQALHATLFRTLGVDPAEAARAQMSPACAHYVDFLLRLGVLAPYPVLLAGLLPCFTVYQEVGIAVSARQVRPNRYQAWIDLYAGTEYAGVVEEMTRWTDLRAGEALPETVRQMRAEHLTALRLEWRFWDGAYRGESWPDETI